MGELRAAGVGDPDLEVTRATAADGFLGRSPDRYAKRLAIVVPYRDRAEHLNRFVPHIRDYFRCDKLDRAIDYSLHVVEQQGGAPFNRGKLKNVGYDLARRSCDYVCFHDVDYLPVWADYAWGPDPARLIWDGLAMTESRERFFGAVVLFDNAAFERVNGFSNEYWGWGAEDSDLRLRCDVAGLGFDRRDGTYFGLQHPHAGLLAPGVYNEEGERTHALFQAKLADFPAEMARDGLSSLRYRVLGSGNFVADGVPAGHLHHWLVDIADGA